MVNGQVANQLGTKADPLRDHIRVDGKLIHGAERHRTFVLNKPKGYVTTVSDPENRPTVMDFFAKMHERLYPVGRLDFQSEGLLIMTNDGELANLLTRAGSGVEKVYMVKVAGQPTEEDLQRLRQGIEIERDRPGSGRVRSAPASIRMIRPGENPWFEVTLIEGRNRELRKIFREVGHFVEKIRRVAYGPLVLDLEPGRFRELSPEEVSALRLTAEGKLKPRIPKLEALVPREVGRSTESRFQRRTPQRRGFDKPRDGNTSRGTGFRPDREDRGGRPQKQWGADSASKAPFRENGQSRGNHPRFERPRPAEANRSNAEFGRERRPEFRREGKPQGKPELRREGRPDGRPEFRREGKPEFRREGRPEFKREGRPQSGPDFRRGGKPQARPEFRREGRSRRRTMPAVPSSRAVISLSSRSERSRAGDSRGIGEAVRLDSKAGPLLKSRPPAKPWTSGPGRSASDRGSRPDKSFGGKPAFGGGRPAPRGESGRGPQSGRPGFGGFGSRRPDFKRQDAGKRPGSFGSRPGNTDGKRRG